MTDKHQTSPEKSNIPSSIEDYAKYHRIHMDDVWRLIEEGALLARRVGDQIFILENRKQLIHLPALPAANAKTSAHQALANQSSSLETKLQHFLSINQATIDHISQLNQEIIQSKEELLAEKRLQIQQLHSEMQRQEKVIRTLKQQIEDLEILTKTLGDRASHTKTLGEFAT